MSDAVSRLLASAKYLNDCDGVVKTSADMAEIHDHMRDMITTAAYLVDCGTNEVHAALKAFEKRVGKKSRRPRYVTTPLRHSASGLRFSAVLIRKAHRAYVQHYSEPMAAKRTGERKFTP